MLICSKRGLIPTAALMQRSLRAVAWARPSTRRGFASSISAVKATNDALITSVDLDLHVNTPKQENLDKIQKWVVFSDLHVSRRTVKVCCEVLRTVRQKAEELGAGVLFLGDFWHERGPLHVKPLNLVIDELQQFEMPMMCLVGNHDQISLGGLEHGLTPISAACRNVHVFEQPTLWQNALWLPYRRDEELLKSAIKAAGPVKAIFAHTDVLGGYVNSQHQAREGIMPDEFGKVPTFLGHYHKPHIVGSSSVQYVGSPYQVSRNEAGQQKHFLVLDRDYQQVDSIPLDIGSRHFSLSNSKLPVTEDLRNGDKVRWNFDSDAERNSAMKDIALLREQGIEVEEVIAPKSAKIRIKGAEQMSMKEYFNAYAHEVSMGADAISRGLQILEEVDQGSQTSKSGRIDLQFQTVELEGYISFKEKTVYHLGKTGVRLVTGRNTDEGEANRSSNGAGKSALVMSALWALTGQSDPRRPDQRGALKGENVVTRGSSKCTVKVNGSVNQRPFTVERSTRKTKGAKLRFTLDGEDMTQITDKATQATMDEMLGCNLLTRVVFHSQAAIGGLLDAGDREFKEVLGLVTDMHIWEKAKDVSSRYLGIVKQSCNSLEQTKRANENSIESFTRRVIAKKNSSDSWEEARIQEENAHSDHVSRAKSLFLQALSMAEGGIGELEAHLGHSTHTQRNGPKPIKPEWEDELSDEESLHEREASIAASKAEELEQELNQVYQQFRNLQKEENLLQGQLKVNQQQRDDFIQNIKADKTETCHTCLQPIDKSLFDSNLKLLESNVKAAEENWHSAREATQEIEDKWQLLKQQYDVEKAHAAEAQTAFRGAQADRIRKFRTELNEAQQKENDFNATLRHRYQAEASLQGAREALTNWKQRNEMYLSSDEDTTSLAHHTSFSDTSQAAQAITGFVHGLERAGMQLREASQSQESFLKTATNPHTAEIAQLQELIDEENIRMTETTDKLFASQGERDILEDLESAFGKRCIQSFAFEGILAELQNRTAEFLAQLSNMTLTLSASRPSSTGKDETERITKTVLESRNGKIEEASVDRLSGGERKRVAIALQLAFAALASDRSRMTSNLLVLDEASQQLDEDGKTKFANLLRNLRQSNIIVVDQADSIFAQVFDHIDEVVKRNGVSYVETYTQ